MNLVIKVAVEVAVEVYEKEEKNIYFSETVPTTAKLWSAVIEVFAPENMQRYYRDMYKNIFFLEINTLSGDLFNRTDNNSVESWLGPL